jgi:hypothetical protein
MVTTCNYNILSNSRTLFLTTAHTKTYQFVMSSPVFAWWRVPTMSSASMLTFLPAGDCLTTNSLFQLSILNYLGLGLGLILRSKVSRSVCLGIKHPSGLTTGFLLPSDNCGFVDVGRCLWREDGSVVYNCCWPSSEQSLSGPSLVGLATICYCLRFETSQFIASYDSQGYGGGIRTPQILTLWKRKNYLTFSGNRTPVVQPVDCLKTDWATPAPLFYIKQMQLDFSFAWSRGYVWPTQIKINFIW